MKYLVTSLAVLFAFLFAEHHSYAAKIKSVQTAKKPWSYSYKKGIYRFELRKGDCWKDIYQNNICSARSEIAFAPVKKNREYWYSWEQKVNSQDTDLFSRIYMGQFFAGKCKGHPPIVQKIDQGEMIIVLRAHRTKKCPRKGGGILEAFFAEETFKLDAWNKIIYQVKWTNKNNGYLNIWINGKQIAKYKGPTSYNTRRGPYMKAGVYRGWYTPGTNIVEFRNIKWGSRKRVVGKKYPSK